MKRILLIVCLLAVAAFGFAQKNHAADDGLRNAVIIVIRHAEKTTDDRGLSPAGVARAQAYVNYFTNFTVDDKPLKLGKLYSAADSKGSQRSRFTLEPLGKALGLPIDVQFSSKDPEKLVAAIRQQPAGGRYLICWHHGVIPQLVRALGADPATLFSKKNVWPDDVFDWLIQLRYDADGHFVQATRISENLMPDDVPSR